MAKNKTLCELESNGFLRSDFKEFKQLVRHGEFICKSCGRVARRKKNLCDPKRLYPKQPK